jgi:hypothetical protein
METQIEFIYEKDGKDFITNDLDVFCKDFEKLEMIESFRKKILDFVKLHEMAESLKNKKFKSTDEEFVSFKMFYESVVNENKSQMNKVSSTQYNRLYDHNNMGGTVLKQWSGFVLYSSLNSSLRDRTSCVQTDYNSNAIGLWNNRVYRIWRWKFEIPTFLKMLTVASVGNTSGHYWNAPNEFPHDIVDGYSSLR